MRTARYLMLFALIHASMQLGAVTLKTIYGTYNITEPVLVELLDHPIVRRLEKVRQYGPSYYGIQKLDYNRYEHSVGVMLLLRRTGASLHEQIAGLLHDVSHTVFSHVGDLLFTPETADSCYQDDHHEAFLHESGLAPVLEKHGFNPKSVLAKNKEFTALECDLPALCADRLEYNLHGALIENLLTQQEVSAMIDNLTFDHDVWYFTDALLAEKLARCSLHMTEHTWGSPLNNVCYSWCAQALKHALSLKIIETNDILYGTDDAVWQKLCACNNAYINERVQAIINPHSACCVVRDTANLPNCVHYTSKFRGVNPLILTATGLHQLTDINKEFAQAFLEVKNKVTTGWEIHYIERDKN